MATAVTTQDKRVAELNVISRKQRSLWGDAIYRLLRNRAALVGLVVIALAALAALFAPLISPYDPEARYGKKRSTTWLGYKVHFTETLSNDRGGPSMTFDYKLRPGIATSTNALRLMEIVGLDLSEG